ncbi:MAG: DUF5672 family protein [Sphingobium sp.]|nr:DUF5672 family protein [Sphingobium sp.]
MTPRLGLPEVTLCAVTSVNIAATVHALTTTLSKIDVAAALLLTDKVVTADHPGVTVVPIPPIHSAQAYSKFLLTRLVDYIDTSHCLIVQWDGHVIDAERWRPDFLGYDYIGASWPQFTDGRDVGNGGFSLRSRRLMKLCRDPGFFACHPEDVAIGRANRAWLEEQGIRFAPRGMADLFSTERGGDVTKSFGYHGAWLMPRVLGTAAFFELYCSLDDCGTIRRDFAAIVRQIAIGRHGVRRALRLVWDQIFHRGR